MIVGAGIALALGILHLIYTFSGNKLTPRDSALQMRMAEVPPVITRGGLLIISKVYFFSNPFRSVLVATVCYILSVVVRLGIGL